MAKTILSNPIADFLIPPPNTPTQGSDTIYLLSFEDASIYALGGHDKVTLAGTGDFFADGGSGNDEIRINTSGDATVEGSGGSDKLFANGSGTYDLWGGAGSDKIYINEMDDHYVNGGTGWDHLYFEGIDHALRFDMSSPTSGTAREFNGWNDPAGTDVIDVVNIEYLHGSNHGDVFVGSTGGDRFYGGDGNDDISGYLGNDYLVAGNGDDHVYGGTGNDTVYGQDGDDFMRGDDGDDRLFGQDGKDSLNGSDGDDYMLGGAGNDSISAGNGADRAYGGDGNDLIRSEAGSYERDQANDVFSGGAGFDTLSYEHAHGGVRINAEVGVVGGEGAGYEVISTSPFHITVMYQDTISGFEKYIGSKFDDTFRGQDDVGQFESFVGGRGDDVFKASEGIDVFKGDKGIDEADYSQFAGRIEADLKTGKVYAYDTEPGPMDWYDILSGVENVTGTDAADIVKGNGLKNVLEGGEGNDTYTGRGGADTFVFDADGPLGHDQITDFGNGADVLSLSGLQFGAEGWTPSEFGDLDSDNDGMLTEFDEGVSYIGSTLRIDFSGGSISLNNTAMLDAGDFVFG